MDEIVRVRIDSETKKKVMFVLKCKGSDLSKEVRKMCDELAKIYDEAKQESEKHFEKEE